MIAPLEKIPQLLQAELELMWAAHKSVGLDGHMCLFSHPSQAPFRSKEPGIQIWFKHNETEQVVQQIVTMYNEGILPNTSLLLNPIIHEKKSDGTYRPIGSGIIWATALSLGVHKLNEESAERIWAVGGHASSFTRGDDENVGLKILAFCDEAQPLAADGKSVIGCRELYELANVESEQYAPYYFLSGLSYLTNNGLFQHNDLGDLFPKIDLSKPKARTDLIRDGSIGVQRVLDAAYCWNAYERHHSLYKKFGTNPADVENNLRFFNLVARDVKLFDSTGPMRKEADEMFEFLVPGLIPRGSVTLLAAAGGAGKSSLAHQLCVMGSIDYEPGEEAPRWLGQRLAIEKCKGICVYFSGEDGPPIINARAAIFDPKGRAKRLMFQRTDFGEGVTFAQHMRRLHKIPDVSIVVIDPARKYLTGDEEDSGAVSEFFEAIEEFAITKGAAVVVVHHLKKGAHPASAAEVLDMLRGSQVFIDRPRVVIGMYRDGPYTVAGLAKNNIPPNMGMVTEERVFARDPKHLGLIWLPGHEGIRNANLTPEELAKLAAKAEKEGRQ